MMGSKIYHFHFESRCSVEDATSLLRAFFSYVFMRSTGSNHSLLYFKHSIGLILVKLYSRFKDPLILSLIEIYLNNLKVRISFDSLWFLFDLVNFFVLKITQINSNLVVDFVDNLIRIFEETLANNQSDRIFAMLMSLLRKLDANFMDLSSQFESLQRIFSRSVSHVPLEKLVFRVSLKNLDPYIGLGKMKKKYKIFFFLKILYFSDFFLCSEHYTWKVRWWFKI